MKPRELAKWSIQWIAGKLVRWSGVVCLNYHRIGDGRGSIFDRGLWSATAEGFDEQLRWLGTHFDVVSPGDLSYIVRVKRGRHVIVTFDDGYEDNFTIAYPILRAHRLPATFFVATGFIDEPRRIPWWDEIAWMVRRSSVARLELPAYLSTPIQFDEPDREQAVRILLHRYRDTPDETSSLFLDEVGEAARTGRCVPSGRNPRWMTWPMLREMRAGGMTIGGHTVNHQILSRVSREAQRREIADCGRRLEEELGVPMRFFSYPRGKRDSFGVETRECLRESGVRMAFSYYGGFRRLDEWDDYDVPRIAVEQETTLARFRAIVAAPWLALD